MTLSHLDLQRISLRSEGALILADGLKGNCSLVSLNLRGNELGVKCSQLLFEAICTTQIIVLDVSENPFSNQGIGNLSKFLIGNPNCKVHRLNI
jgi:hypothetical protein